MEKSGFKGTLRRGNVFWHTDLTVDTGAPVETVSTSQKGAPLSLLQALLELFLMKNQSFYKYLD